MAKPKESSMTLAEVLSRKAHRPDYETRPTHIEGLSLRIEEGKDPQLLRRNLGKLATSGKMVARLRGQISKLKKREESRADIVTDLAVGHEGLRGFTSESANLSLTVFPSYSIDWVRDKLKESLGVAYQTVVGEDLNATVSVPLGQETPFGPLTSDMVEAALTRGLYDFGFSEEDVKSIVHTEIGLRVDEARLGEMITNDQINLVEGTATVTETWKILTNPIDKTLK